MSYNYQSASEELILHGLFRCVIRSWGFPLTCCHKATSCGVASTWKVSSKGDSRNQRRRATCLSQNKLHTKTEWLHWGQQRALKEHFTKLQRISNVIYLYWYLKDENFVEKVFHFIFWQKCYDFDFIAQDIRIVFNSHQFSDDNCIVFIVWKPLQTELQVFIFTLWMNSFISSLKW